MELDEILSQSPLPDLVTIIGHCAREPMSPKLIRRLLAGVDLKVGLDYDTHMYLKKLSAVSGRHLWQIGNSALSAYLKDPDSFRHCIVDASPDAHVVMNTSLERADFFTREAAASPVTARSRFIGRVVREFIRRETFEEMAEWFYSYSDVLEVVARNQIGEGPEADEWVRMARVKIVSFKRRKDVRRGGFGIRTNRGRNENRR